MRGALLILLLALLSGCVTRPSALMSETPQFPFEVSGTVSAFEMRTVVLPSAGNAEIKVHGLVLRVTSPTRLQGTDFWLYYDDPPTVSGRTLRKGDKLSFTVASPEDLATRFLPDLSNLVVVPKA